MTYYVQATVAGETLFATGHNFQPYSLNSEDAAKFDYSASALTLARWLHQHWEGDSAVKFEVVGNAPANLNDSLRAINEAKGYLYQGKPTLQHIPNGLRREVGVNVADYMQQVFASYNNNEPGTMCPGCALIVLFNASLEQAKRAGQPVEQMAKGMIDLYQALLDSGVTDYDSGRTEEIVFA